MAESLINILKSRHLATNNVTGSSLLSTYLKNQMMVFGGTNKNITASHLKQALNMTICQYVFPSTFPRLQQNLNGMVLMCSYCLEMLFSIVRMLPLVAINTFKL
jgi:hypothetical protein